MVRDPFEDYGQAYDKEFEERLKRRKAKEREKRIKENKAKSQESFDLDAEDVIKMTNKNKIKQEQVRKRRISEKEKRRQRRNKKIKLALKIILLLGILACGITFAMISPIFNIKNIQVVGNNQVSSETIISLSRTKARRKHLSLLGRTSGK